MMGPDGMIAFSYLLATYIIGFQAFAMGENKRLSVGGVIFFLLSPVVFPLLLVVLVAKVFVDSLRIL